MTSQVGVAPVVQPQVQTSRSYGRLIMFGILILASVLYGPALRGLPIWEDNQLIRAAGTDSLRECFTRPFLDAYFRPLVSLSFLVDHHFWAGEPFMYHQTNILLHVLTTAVWISALQAAFRNWWIAPVGGLMFAVQPAQVSTVAWIGGRTDSLCALWVALFVWT
ncbi:MAG TPA: hypothetical protein VFB21_06400, partial [Chthonomonadaceae bacterium]|nr:hypothetical protein [Chthonomonadaceae bacterium]